MDKITVKDVIIDVCPQCKGIYYDRGEMKKVLAGSLDAETMLSRLPYDGSDFICPACSINMDKISARKGELTYELYFCRSCLATFLKNEELLKVKRILSGATFRQPSALRPKTIVATTYMQPPKFSSTPAPAPAADATRRENYGAASAKPAAALTKPAAASVYSTTNTASFTAAEEKKALAHYKSINYEYADEHESISASSYLFCLFSNLPLEVYNPRYYFPLVLVIIIATNSLIFALTFKLISAASGASNLFANASSTRALEVLNSFYYTLGLIPNEFFSLKWLLNLFSYQFVHASFMHFVVNMYFLWVFGDNVCDIFYDRKEPVDREMSFLAFYLFTGIIGAFVHMFFYYGFSIPLVGASGAVAGIMGAYMRLFPGAKFYQVIFFYPFKIPAIYYIGLWIIGQVFMALALGISSHVSWPAHLGGFLAGYIGISYFIPYAPEEITPES
jgi:membrane associated rhomboid family serine protease/Zn-finger nucleic acid-binding protein